VTGDTQRLVITRRRHQPCLRHHSSPYLRRTPVVQLDLAGPVTLKLEQLQCAGSFKARGAFTNLLLRDVPPAGVVAASGGKPRRRRRVRRAPAGHPGRIFVPTVSSPAKIERIRELADLVGRGDRYGRRAGGRGAVDRDLRRDQRARLRPAGDHTSARPRSPSSSTTRPGRSTRCWSRSAAAASSPGSPPTSRAPRGSSAWSPTARRPSSGPGRPASPSTRLRAASPWTRSPRAGSGSWSSDHPGLRRGRGARGRRRHP